VGLQHSGGMSGIALREAGCHNRSSFDQKICDNMKKCVLITMALACFGAARAFGDVKVDFVKDIEPLLQQNCIKCHGPEKQKGGLRLDAKAAAMKGGKDGAVIVAGQADKSDLYHRITLPAGSDDIMPSKGDPLTKAQTDLIKNWINQGAMWPEGLVAKATEEPGASATPTGFAGLTPIKPTSGEAGAITKLEAAGVAVRPIAMNVNWREANFHIMGTNVADATIAPIKDVLTLVDLNLAGTKVTDAGLAAIEGLTNLVILHLEHTQIGDAGLAHLKKLPHLAYLNLFGTPVTDKGLEQLQGLASLKHLYLWQTKVTAEGATNLLKALPSVVISRGWENEPAAQKVEEKKAEKADEKKEAKK
jgi:mono/diheme cytochrome c family protein